MGLDSRYVLAPSLQEFFIDKDSGLPMSGGQVFFFEDDARTIPKDVFEISGSPPNYSYTVLPNPVTLSAVGTFQDGSGNDILPYYFPFDDMGDVELYYIEVYNSDGVLQFTREGFPNFTEANVTADQDVTNFVPNGQFLLHNNIPSVPGNSFTAGKVTQPVTIIAQGGWTFERDIGSTATDFVTFPRYGSAVQIPTGNPRYAVQIQTTIAGSDTRKDLCLKFPDVNKFASTSQAFNFYFEAQSVTGNDINNVQILVRKFFGTGGSPSATTETEVTSITLKAQAMQSFNTPILFGTNVNKSIGTNNDDYVQIVIRLPPTGVQTALFTDFAMTINSETLSAFPTQTEAEQLDESTAGWLPAPNPDGSDLYLPVRLTPSGMEYDHSEIGKICAATYNSPGIGELLCDGSFYLTSDYSADGIPYSRLQAKLFSISQNVPIFGTGYYFATTSIQAAATNNIFFTTNSTSGSLVAPAAVSSGFSISTIHTTAATYAVQAFLFGATSILVKGLTPGASLATPSAGTSGFTVSDSYQGVNRNRLITDIHYFSIVTVSAAALANPGGAGKYFTYQVTGPTNYYMWFQITNETDPAPGGTGIKVNLQSGNSAGDVAIIVMAALNAGGQYLIQTTAASAVTQSSYWTFGTPNLNSYYVWYNKDSGGVDPKPGGFTAGIEVDILAGDTNAQVATKTTTAINKTYFAVPDLRGMFLRGNDPTAIWDIDANSRFGYTNPIYGNQMGTFEIDQLYNHDHTVVVSGQSNTASVSHISFTGGNNSEQLSYAPSSSLGAQATGGTESRPVNAFVNWMIKY